MALKELSVALGVLAGTAGVANSGYGLYRNLVLVPERNAEQNLELLDQTPLLVEMVEIEPDTGMAMRVDVTIKVFRNGDILIESGQRREIIPFRLARASNPLAGWLPAARAGETVTIEGKTYEVETVRYVEGTKKLGDGRIERVRTFANGTVETAVIDIRSNRVVETRTHTKTLTEAEREAIANSPYKKKVYKPKP